MELQNERLFEVRERMVRQWLVPVLVTVVAVGLPGAWFGPRVFNRFQEMRLLTNGRDALTVDPVRAAICFRRVLAINADNAAALRGLAELADRYAPTEAAALRERVAHLAPESYADARAWALSSLRVGQFAQAEEAYRLMTNIGSGDPEHFALGGDIALAGGHVREARERYERSVASAPGNERARLQVAAIDIVSVDADARDSARATLRHLRENPVLRHAATRALIADLMERSQVTEALSLARDFLLDPETTFGDRLSYLGILRSVEAPSGSFVSSFQGTAGLSLALTGPARGDTFASVLNELQERARSVPTDAAALIAFLNSRGSSVAAAEWAVRLPGEISSKPPVAPQLAEAYRRSVNWPRLSEFLAEADWESSDFLRAAFSTYVKRAEGDRGGAAAEWAAAVRLADYRPERLSALEQATASWNWVEEWEEIVWTIARTSKRPREALIALADFYRTKFDTQKLFTVWSRLMEIDPADVAVRKNWVHLSLLLNNDKFRTATVIEELYKSHPEDPEIVCSYALLMNRRMRFDEAIRAMERLSVEQRRSPRVAAYYGLILFAADRKKEAGEFISRAKVAPLFPQEQDLVAQVRRSLD